MLGKVFDLGWGCGVVCFVIGMNNVFRISIIMVKFFIILILYCYIYLNLDIKFVISYDSDN